MPSTVHASKTRVAMPTCPPTKRVILTHQPPPRRLTLPSITFCVLCIHALRKFRAPHPFPFIPFAHSHSPRTERNETKNPSTTTLHTHNHHHHHHQHAEKKAQPPHHPPPTHPPLETCRRGKEKKNVLHTRRSLTFPYVLHIQSQSLSLSLSLLYYAAHLMCIHVHSMFVRHISSRGFHAAPTIIIHPHAHTLTHTHPAIICSHHSHKALSSQGNLGLV